jgi:hypothetical protein
MKKIPQKLQSVNLFFPLFFATSHKYYYANVHYISIFTSLANTANIVPPISVCALSCTPFSQQLDQGFLSRLDQGFFLYLYYYELSVPFFAFFRTLAPKGKGSK